MKETAKGHPKALPFLQCKRVVCVYVERHPSSRAGASRVFDVRVAVLLG
jgi:hypothetical protein